MGEETTKKTTKIISNNEEPTIFMVLNRSRQKGSKRG